MQSHGVDFRKCRSFHKSRIANLAVYCIISRAPIKILNLTNCQLLSDNALRHIGNLCGNRLQILNLNGSGEKITKTGLKFVLSKCRLLQHLDLSLYQNNANLIDNEVASLIASNCKELKELAFKSFTITDEGFNLLSSCTNLQKINLSNCPSVTIEGLRCLMSHCSITDLDISYNQRMLNNDALQDSLLQFWTSLQILRLNNSPQINDQTIQALLPYTTSLVELQLNRTSVTEYGLERVCRR